MKQIYCFLFALCLCMPSLGAQNVLGEKVSLKQAPALVQTRTEEADTQWSEWSMYGKTSFPDGVYDRIRDIFSIWIPDEPAPVFEKTFDVMRRQDLNNEDNVQFVFKKVVNGNDIMVSYTPSTHEAWILPSALAPAPSGYQYENFMLASRSPGAFFEETKKFSFPNTWLMVNDYSGWSFGRQILTMDDAPEFIFEFTSSKRFYGKDVKVIPLSFTASESVKKVRIVIVPLERGILYTDIAKLYGSNPDVELPYSDVSLDHVGIQVKDYETLVYAFPLGDDGVAVGEYIATTFYSNIDRVGKWGGQWEYLGEGRMTDYIANSWLPQDEIYVESAAGDGTIVWKEQKPSASKVRISRNIANPGLYRLENAFGPTHPLYDKVQGHIDPAETYYVYIDASDPSRVIIDKSFTGLKKNSEVEWPGMIYTSPAVSGENMKEYFDKEKGFIWGKLIDNRLTFSTTPYVNSGIYLNNWEEEGKYPFNIELPGYVEYSLSIDSNNMTITDLSPEVASVDCVLVPEKDVVLHRWFYEQLFNDIEGNGSQYNVVNVPVNGKESLAINIEDLTPATYGRFLLVVIPKDSNGNPHYGTILQNKYFVYDDPAWKLVEGGIPVCDNGMLSSPFEGSSFHMFGEGVCLEAWENEKTPDVYRINNMFGIPYDIIGLDAEKTTEYFQNPGFPVYTYIDARNSNRVNIYDNADLSVPESLKGINTYLMCPSNYYGFHYINTMANFSVVCNDYNSLDEVPDVYFGTMDADNNVVFNSDNSVLGLQNYDDLFVPRSGRYLKITLPHAPKTSGIDDVDHANGDSDLPVEYYTIDGLRVDRPEAGRVYIRRQGASAKKIVIQ